MKVIKDVYMPILKRIKNKSMNMKKKIIVAMILVTLLPALFAGLVTELIFYDISTDSVHDFSSYENLFISYFLGTNQFAEKIKEDFDNQSNPQELVELFEAYKDDERFEGLGVILLLDDALFYQSSNIDETIDIIELEEDEDGFSYKVANGKYITFREVNFVYADGENLNMLFVLDSEHMFMTIAKYWISYVAYFILILIVFIIILLWWIKKSMDKPLNGIREMTQKMKSGDLESPLVYENEDEFKELANSIEELRLSLQESLKNQQRLEEEKSQIIRNVSHDLRTPLTAIRGYVAGIKDGVAKDPETINEYLDTIQVKADAIDSLINDLKVLSDLDDEIETYNFRDMNLMDFIKDCVEDMSFDVKHVGGNFELESSSDLCLVNADPLKLKRIFTNIIENSIKYRSDHPLLIKLAVQCEEESVFIRISDNGIGVDIGLKDKLFERFFRADSARGSETGGSGIGLSICKDIIKKHQGTIEAFPGVAGGLTIEMSFPLRRQL